MFKIYNTLSRKKEEFKPINKGKVGMYSCGPTVYNYPHIGNYRAYIVADLLKRYLLYKKFKVKHVMNITDVDDKTIRDSQKEGISLGDFTKKYTEAFMEDLSTLNIDKADKFPRATGHIKEMVATVKKLLDKGIAYKGDDGCIYYSVSKFKDYGKLAKIKVKELKAGARVKQDEYEKESASDFALWKAWDKEDGDVFWETEIGKGRPGWHIECSAMSSKYLGEQFDIHTGGIDLIFPHHENEIAQAEGASGKKPFVKYWVHNEWLLVEGKKMSKSLGNFFTLRDILDKGYDAMAIRYVLLATHYRQQMNFTFKDLDAAKSAIQRLNDFMLKLDEASGDKDLKEIRELIDVTRAKFEKAMDNDMEISEALAAVFEFVRSVNKLKLSAKDADKVKKLMLELDSVLGLELSEVEKEELSEDIDELVKKREKARAKKDWATADSIRDELKEKGIILEDTPQGIRWKKIK
ncbi:cysteine--tRNA ligase [Candidatus Woesearchaeota archaeon]|nr:cysteine--tRNA ligase [Candidatus Woesearchaeota archaeon]